MNAKLVRLLGATALSPLFLVPAAAVAQQAAPPPVPPPPPAPSTSASGIAEGSEIVVTATRTNQLAPVTASLDARQPQSIVSRSLIQDSLPATVDFNQIALITPSVTNINGNNGIGLSESKAQIRGFQDGEYNVTMDGVPFNDTNDPTHHSTTFWPSNTIETLVVDRGPGNASQLGQATFGGNINLFSRVARDQSGTELLGSYGSFNTWLARFLVNSGTFGGGNRFVATGQYVHTDGALSHETYRNANIFGKVELPLSPAVKLTLLGTYNNNKFNQPDKDGSTLYQQSLYGRYFSLNDDPSTPQYYKYNHTTKTTDFEIATLEADVSRAVRLENRAYTYYYDNETLSANDVTVTDLTKLSTTDSAGVVHPGNVPGYTKTNKYRTYGDIPKAIVTFGPVAKLTAGAWFEKNDTFRQQTDVDLTTGEFNYVEKKVTAPATGVHPGAVTPRYVKFDQDSNGHQIQEFAEFEIRPIPSLAITPGFKHVDFTRKIDAKYNQTTRYAQRVSNHYHANLPFLQANWRVTPQFSVYGEYARGFLAPPLSSLYVPNPDHNNLKPEKSTNLQAGVVYHGPWLSFDADVYHIKFTNKFTPITDPVFGKIFTNIGGATYKGVEAEATVSVTRDVALFVNGSLNSAKDSDFDLPIAYAPKSTAAGGIVVRHGPWRGSLIDKYTGPQWTIAPALNSAGAVVRDPAYHLGGYNGADLALSYDIGRFRIGGNVSNLFNSKHVTQINPVGTSVPPGTVSPFNFDQYYYQPPRAFTLELTARI